MIKIKPCEDIQKWVNAYNTLSYAPFWQSPIYALTRHKNSQFFFIEFQNKSIGLFSLYPTGKFGISKLNSGPLFLEGTNEKTIQKSLYALRKFLFPLRRPTLLSPLLEHISPKVFKKAYFLNFKKKSESGTAIIDLTLNEEAIRKSLKSKWRNQLNKAEKEGLVFKEEEQEYLTLLKEYDKTKATKGYSGIPSHWVKTMKTLNLPDHTLYCVTTYYQNTLIGGAILVKHGKTATYLIGWQNNDYRNLNIGNFYLWNSLLFLKEKGVHTFDLGGINYSENPSIAKFKSGLNGQWIDGGGTWI